MPNCEKCGMIGEVSVKDEFGVTHYYCAHHAPAGSVNHTNHAMASHDSHHNHSEHAGHNPDAFRDKFWLSLLLTIPVVLYSDMIQHIFGYTAPAFPGSSWLPLVLATIIFFYGGWVFLTSAVVELKARRPGMMTLIALAIITSYGYSLYAVVFASGMEFFFELSTLITIMLLGHWLEMRAVSQAQGALAELAKLLPDTAELVNGQMVAVSSLTVGQHVLVRPGSKVPADGVVLHGQSSVNESMMTGESALVAKQEHSTVVAGTINGSGALTVSVTAVGEQTALAGIMRLVAEAEQSKSQAQVVADKAAFALTIVAASSGVITLLLWLWSGATANTAIERMVAVFVMACPHALGLAIPLVTSIATSLAAKNGLLIKRRIGLETAREVNVVVFDKTGTLTMGQLGVTNVWPVVGTEVPQLLTLAASVEAKSEHAIAAAITAYAKAQNIVVQPVENFATIAGVAASGVVGGKTIMVGGPSLLTEQQLTVPEALAAQTADIPATIVYVVVDKQIIGALACADSIRPESKAVVEQLKAQNIRVAMLTGDATPVANYIAQQLGITEVFAQVVPGQKAATIQTLQQDGSIVAMVGDGVNDAPALTQADLGIAVGAGTDVAIESADIVLVRSNPLDVVKIFKLSRATYRKMLQNLWWATGYNALAIPLAAGAFAGIGLLIPVSLGALLMSVSTIIVAANAQLLRRLKL